MKWRLEFAHARLQDLDHIHRLLDDVCRDAQLDESLCYAVRLSVEEAYVNIVDHGYSPAISGPITIQVQSSADQIVATLTDRASPFAPEDAPLPDLNVEWQDRQIGGLGWLLIRDMMDEIRYESDDTGNNQLTLVKRLHSSSEPEVKRGRLEITVVPRGRVTVVALGGRIDALSANSLRQVLEDLIARGKKHLVMDLARVAFISSAGVYVLLRALRETRAGKGDLRVTRANKEVQKVLGLVGFLEVSALYADLDSAVKSFED